MYLLWIYRHLKKYIKYINIHKIYMNYTLNIHEINILCKLMISSSVTLNAKTNFHTCSHSLSLNQRVMQVSMIKIFVIVGLRARKYGGRFESGW